MSDNKQKVALEKAMTWAGINYAPGLNTMPEGAAKYAIKRNFGKAVNFDSEEPVTAETVDVGETEVDSTNVLSLEETMKRFGEGDSSEIVFKSLKFHQQEIVSKRPPPPYDLEKGSLVDSKKNSENAVTSEGGGAQTGGNVAPVVESPTADKSTQTEPASPKTETSEADASETEQEGSQDNGLPADFPKRDKFRTLGFNTVEEVQKTTRENLIALGFTAATADKALSYGK